MSKLIVVAVSLGMLAGCATTVPVPMQNVVTLSSGDMIEYVTVDGKDHSGVMTRVVDRYTKDRKTGQVVLMTKDGFSGPGLGNTFMQGGFAGLAQSAGIIGGAALLRPSNTNVSNNNSGGGAGSAVGDGAAGALTVNATGTGGAGGSAVSGATATSASAAAATARATQAQIQGQAQGQIQGQSQKNNGRKKGWVPPGQAKK